MSEILDNCINTIKKAKASWFRYVTGNDTGKTGSHQAGFYVPKEASSLLFDSVKRGENRDKMVKIQWQDDFFTDSRMIYYGVGTRNEFWITRFGKDFPFLQDEYVGSILIISKFTEEDYKGYVLSSDEDIEDFFSFFSFSPNENNRLIEQSLSSVDDYLDQLCNDFVSQYDTFPESSQMALGARECFNMAHSIKDFDLQKRPDEILIKWVDTEFDLFRRIEEKVYRETISKSASVDDFIKIANSVLNRRKSRAGKSLEHHLADIFSINRLIFEAQAVTEENKKPDFLFPNGLCYHNLSFPADALVVLGAKTTCKDRWRQVLTEADRCDEKYLFTLQPGISRNQLKEMRDSHLTLVVPRQHVALFPREHQNELMNLTSFIGFVAEKQTHLPSHFLVL